MRTSWLYDQDCLLSGNRALMYAYAAACCCVLVESGQIRFGTGRMHRDIERHTETKTDRSSPPKKQTSSSTAAVAHYYCLSHFLVFEYIHLCVCLSGYVTLFSGQI